MQIETLNAAESIVKSSAAFVLGACIGSFLNVCIYRLPQLMSVVSPSTSFCPTCRESIAWYDNIPILSWLLLRGRCRRCGASISPRYLLVELVFALIALGLWLLLPLPQALIYFAFACVLGVVVAVDAVHRVIPNEVSVGGVVLGLVLNTIFPSALGALSSADGFLRALLGAATGFGIVWAITEGGKLVFGNRKVTYATPAPFTWEMVDGAARFVVDGAVEDWNSFFFRKSDHLTLSCASLSINGGTARAGEIKCFEQRFEHGSEVLDHSADLRITGHIGTAILPREAMGFGDVKFAAAIGAFFGWQCAIFTIVAAATLGAIAGVALRTRARVWGGERPESMPFGPYLAAGAVLWITCGPAFVTWYLAEFKL